VLSTITDPSDKIECTHGCQCPHWPSTFSKTVFKTHSPRWHHRPALHGVPSAQGMYCVRQPACSPISVVHHSLLHTGYGKYRNLFLTGTICIFPCSLSICLCAWATLNRTECGCQNNVNKNLSVNMLLNKYKLMLLNIPNRKRYTQIIITIINNNCPCDFTMAHLIYNNRLLSK
jgi:hypothetical protein